MDEASCRSSLGGGGGHALLELAKRLERVGSQSAPADDHAGASRHADLEGAALSLDHDPVLREVRQRPERSGGIAAAGGTDPADRRAAHTVTLIGKSVVEKL